MAVACSSEGEVIASSTCLARVIGKTGISCSDQSSGWSRSTSTSTRRVSAGALMPSSFRMTAASLPTHCLFTTLSCGGALRFEMTRFVRRSMSRPVTSCAPCAFISAFSRSAIDSTAMSSFSSTQMMLLSREAPATISLPALAMSAVSSTTTGGFPGPAQIAFLPLFIAALTTPPPPVTTTSRTFGCFIISPAVSCVGSPMQQSRLRGPPAAAIALLRSRTVKARCLGVGWDEDEELRRVIPILADIVSRGSCTVWSR